MDFYLGNMHESRHLSLYVINGVHFDATLVFSELRPLEHRQTKTYGGLVKGIDMTVKLEDFLYPTLAGFSNHIKCRLLEDAVIALLVSFAKITPGHGFADTEMVGFTGMSLHGNNEITQALYRFDSCPNISVRN